MARQALGLSRWTRSLSEARHRRRRVTTVVLTVVVQSLLLAIVGSM
ncbi:hypothetical protein CURTO8I2_70351 [Curtobacterium sp. 8I-2]|nr:hypothetical protein CURTO8I2_70351 [Curtobacterium sp. 8I-2]